MTQLALKLDVAVAREIDGIEMGVLKDGTPYLNSRGLARLCGVAPSTILEPVTAWGRGDRTGKVARFLISQGIEDPMLYIDTSTGEHAHPEHVVLTFLEYYAFETAKPSEQAKLAMRKLVRGGFRAFVYTAIGYIPAHMAVPREWRQFHDRLLLNSSPIGFFSVFKEIADFVISAIREGLTVDATTVPDISVGKIWSTYWVSQGLEERFGARAKHPHVYPDYFPQAGAGQIDAYVYPIEALPEFRKWMYRTYVPEKFPAYLKGKVARGSLPPSTAELIVKALMPPDQPRQLEE